MKNINLLLIAILMTAIMFSSCKCKKDTGANDKTTDVKNKNTAVNMIKFDKKTLVVDPEFQGLKDSVDYKILSASIENNELKMKVSYLAGEGDEFDLKFNGMYMKSLPLKVMLYLVHNKKTNGTKNVETELVFDLLPLQRNAQEIIITLFSYPEQLNYKY